MKKMKIKKMNSYLIDVELQYISQYITYSEYWDHEHCSFCFAKISEHKGDLHNGYCTTDSSQAHWVCPDCFDNFKDEFNWKLRL